MCCANALNGTMKIPRIIVKNSTKYSNTVCGSSKFSVCKVTRGAVLWRKNTILHSNYLGSFGTPVFPSLLCQPAKFISPAISVSFYCWFVVLLKLVFSQFNANHDASQKVS